MAFANRGALEGFICPNCMVKFPSDARVRAHWIEFHSGVKKRETPDRENERVRTVKRNQRLRRPLSFFSRLKTEFPCHALFKEP